MLRRRASLSVMVVLLVAANTAFFAWRWHSVDAVGTVTWVGIDSLSIEVPASQPAVRLHQGEWDSNDKGLAASMSPVQTMAGRERALAFITLAPQPTYAHFIEAIRDLKARRVCNVAVREGGRPWRATIPLPDGSFDGLDVPALVLCGQQLGDAGFSGTLPPDGPIRLLPRGTDQ
ncbi:hypothetical protein [Sphingomonas psychrotolerans]|uniref:Uncharacterized protein n=1 Tax=Sphingomonas psychrotolerans TaxID=1327635 RepID=A0A2K8MIR3_9SPHN|nr:hypothetical protein [Sphingomonas psychrotolerans]ATY33778.1 hypothetical protein CVN68_18935 [Sphingomonas psychrotolerans]